MNWFIPAFVSRSPDSGGGIRLEEGTRRWPRSSKKRRNVSRIRRPSMARLVYRRLLRELAPALLHRAPALGDRLRDPLAELEQAALRPTGDRARGDLLHLFAREPRREDRPGGSGAQAEREPEDPPHFFSPSLPRNFETAFDTPAPNEITLTSGLEAACSTRPETFSTRLTISEADSSMPSTRTSSRLVLTTEFRTSVSRGTVSSRTPSISSLVLSSMRKVFSSTTHRNRTSRPQKAARTISATSPELVARTAEVGMSGLLAGSGFPCGHHTEGGEGAVGPSRAVGRAIPSWVSSPAGPSGPHSRCPARHRGVPATGSAARSIVPLLGPLPLGLLPDGLLALARRLVVALPLEPHRTVLLLDHVSRVVVRVLVALAVP